MGRYQDELKKIGPPPAELRAHIPEVYEGFATTNRAVYLHGALSAATKEQIADGASTDGLRGPGADGQLGVAIQLDGGGASVYGPEAWEAFKEFKERHG